MRNLALTDEILMRVDKPARYIGGEYNSVIKDSVSVSIRFAMCFPDVYEIGMSPLGIAILYDMFNEREDTWCERVYSPWVDLDQIMLEKKIPLFALESQDPVKDFDFLGFSISYEMCYTNILQVLELAQIPLLSSERSDKDPIILGGGPCTYNPEPLADFFDLFYIGEGEVSYNQLLDLYKESKHNGETRTVFLKKAAQIPGIYVPSLYDVTYHEDGTVASIEPIDPEIPPVIKRQVVVNPSEIGYPRKPVIPFVKAVQDRVVLEIMRGCIRGCRFCQAGTTYRPCRSRAPGELFEIAKESLEATGHEEISLSSLSTSDYKYLSELLDLLLPYLKEKNVELELPSMRIDAFSLDIMKRIGGVKRGSFTFAPEAGTQRLRNVINKGLTTEEIMEGAGLAFAGGWNKVKLYFMLGLPDETDEDAAGIAELADQVARVYYQIPKEQRNGRCQITVSSSYFIPKPFTPFQWSPMLDIREYERRAYLVKDAIKTQLNAKSIRFQWHGSEMSVMEAVLARGDRRLSRILMLLHQRGCRFDAWTEHFDADAWHSALDELSIDPAFYANRIRPDNEIFPWDHIDAGLRKGYLLKEFKRAMNGEVTPHCRQKCSGCGINTAYHGGVCFEDKN